MKILAATQNKIDYNVFGSLSIFAPLSFTLKDALEQHECRYYFYGLTEPLVTIKLNGSRLYQSIKQHTKIHLTTYIKQQYSM